MEPIYKVIDLKKSFPAKSRGFFKGPGRITPAVDGVSFEVYKGETFGIVGESGCGKTTLARLMLRLIEPTDGRIFYAGREITRLKPAEMKALRRKMQMIFQDPYGSLNPKKNILEIVAEPLQVHGLARGANLEEKVRQALTMVDLPDNDDFLSKMPEELSGGQRQRIGIARALVIGAEFIIGDEPVSMLDASVKAGIIALLTDLKQKKELTYIFITHEIGLAYHICDRIAVMYRGRIVELGRAEAVIQQPLHPYTGLLMQAIPPLQPDTLWAKDLQKTGDAFSGGQLDQGCRFRARCPRAVEICGRQEPALKEIQPGRFAACEISLEDRL
ncbi:MAG: ABC transporter ATP-binding protein [Desulfobacteraceae bacterium]|nr:MAG: ABC transporter ATP-binding protein [Desulfobacteraceae bacterium]